MERFKRDIDSQHAPEALIELTIRRIHQKNSRKKSDNENDKQNGRSNKNQPFGLIVVVVGIIIFSVGVIIITMSMQPQRVYNQVALVFRQDMPDKRCF
ncbi:MAG: hypothetical protein NC124_09065 [Clostridium sp.]|nr:hypothetical protein [Clostridium sp.]